MPLVMTPTKNNAVAIESITRNFFVSLFFNLVNLVNNKPLIDIKVAKVFHNQSNVVKSAGTILLPRDKQSEQIARV